VKGERGGRYKGTRVVSEITQVKMTRRGGRVKGEMVEERERDTHTYTNTQPKIALIASLEPLTTRDTKDGHGNW